MGFNGATLGRAWKPEEQEWKTIKKIASMGPRSVERGNPV